MFEGAAPVLVGGVLTGVVDPKLKEGFAVAGVVRPPPVEAAGVLPKRPVLGAVEVAGVAPNSEGFAGAAVADEPGPEAGVGAPKLKPAPAPPKGFG